MPNLSYYLHQLRILPFKEVLRRANEIGNRYLRDRIGKVRSRLLGTPISERNFLESALGNRFPGQDAVALHFRTAPRPSFFLDRAEARAAYHDLTSNDKENIIGRAGNICEHTFDLLGSGQISLGPIIDWHRDFKTGYRWNPRSYYRDVTIPYDRGDIKVPWELSRFSHAVTLGQAYWLTDDEKYAVEFVAQVNNWIDSNRPQFGVNWQCTMDVAIRACNWIAGYYFFRHSPSLSDAFVVKFLKSLYQHGRHIKENLEYSEIATSNHYLSNITGLVMLGVMFPEFSDSADWRAFGIRELGNEMQKQVRPDGCDYEASTSYHRLVLELFLFPTLLLVINDPAFKRGNYREVADSIFGSEYTGKLYAMFEAVLFLLKPDGMMPQIGDNDNGRLHIFADRNVLDMRYLLNFGAIFFNEAKFKIREFGLLEESLWVFGRDGIVGWQQLTETSVTGLLSRAFPETGWYVMRGKRTYLMVSCGPNGLTGNGSHTHNDKLSFELHVNGNDIIADPGTYVYTPDGRARNLFRSTAYHNTVGVNSLEQNTYNDRQHGLFTMNNEAQAKAVWTSDAGEDTCVGEHFGFDKFGFHHRRTFFFKKNDGVFIIADTITGDHTRSTAFFHLSPGTPIERFDRDVFQIGSMRIAFKGSNRVDIKEAWYSPGYGLREKSICLEVQFITMLETHLSCASTAIRGT